MLQTTCQRVKNKTQRSLVSILFISILIPKIDVAERTRWSYSCIHQVCFSLFCAGWNECLFSSLTCEVAIFFHDSRGIHNNVSRPDRTSQPDKDPSCLPAGLRHNRVGGVIDPSQSRAAALCSPGEPDASEQTGTSRICRRFWKSNPNWAERALVSRLITADSRLSSPCLHSSCSLSFPHHPTALVEKVLLMTEEGYSIYLQAKPSRASSPAVPAEHAQLKAENSNKLLTWSWPDFLTLLQNKNIFFTLLVFLTLPTYWNYFPEIIPLWKLPLDSTIPVNGNEF